MRGVNMDNRDGPRVVDPKYMLGVFAAEVLEMTEQWQKRLDQDPMCFEVLTHEMKALFDRGLEMFMAGILARAMAADEHLKRATQLRDNYDIPLRSGQERQVEIQMAPGFHCFATTLYCQPKNPVKEREKATPGLDIELSLFGFTEGIALWMVSKIVRTVVLAPSLEQAHQELTRDGITLERNMIDRIVERAGLEQDEACSELIDGSFGDAENLEKLIAMHMVRGNSIRSAQ